MPEEQEMIMYLSTHADDNPEKAAVPFVLAGAALVMDVRAVIVLQGESVKLAQKGFVETMPQPGGFPPFPKLLSDFMELGGELHVCAPCIKSRGIEESTLVEGARATAGAQVNLLALKANALFTL
jgi:uncharacterized protein